METDSEVIDKVKKGDREAYGIIVKKYMRKAYFIALGFVGDSNDALDISQTAFIKAYRSLSKFDQERSFYPWFYAILRNLSFNFIKRKKLIPIIPLEKVAGSNLEPSKKYYQDDTREIVGKAISSLPELEREVILLKYFQELSYKEMAQMLNCPIGTVMSRLYYARKKLKENLEKYFG